MSEKLEENIQREAFVRAITSTFFSVESALVIAGAILLTAAGIAPFDWWQPWFWIAFGVLAEAALIGVSLTDKKHWIRVAQEHLAEKYDPDDIKNERSRERLERALTYRAGMEQLIYTQSGPKRTNLRMAADEMDKGIEVVYNLGRRLDVLMSNELIRHDIETVPQAVTQMEKRLELEQDLKVKAELERALKTKQAQLDNLHQLESTMKRADIQIDNMLAAMGTAYTQMQLMDAKSIDSSRARRLLDDVSEQVEKTQDVIYAMDEVYRSSSI